MYNLPEYIILSRSAYLVDDIRPIQECEECNYEVLFNLDKNIESLFVSMFQGCSFSKFVLIKNEKYKERRYIPLYLLEVPSYKDGKTLLLPMICTRSGLMGIQTIFPYSDSLEKQPALFELMPTYLLKDKNPMEFLEFLKGSDEYSEENVKSDIQEMEDKISFYFDTTGYILNNINKTFSSLSEFNIQDISINSEDDKYSKYIRNNYTLDQVKENKIESMPIRPEMFMPLIIKRNDVTDNPISSPLVLIHSFKRVQNNSDRVICSSKIVSINNVESINNIINDETSESNGSYVPPKIFVNVPDNCRYIIIDSTCMIYTGEGKLFSTIVDPCCEDRGYFSYMDLNKLSLSENDEEEIEESPYLNPLEGSASTESMKSSFKNIVKKGKEIGMDFKSDLMPYLRKMIGLPKEIVSEVYKFITRTFNKVNDLEKNKSLDYQEKVLNDEISECSETLEKIFSNTLIAIGSLMIPTTLILQVMIFFIGKSINENLRVRAIERMEHRLEDIIDRLDKKIEFANQDYDKKAVNELKKQRSLYVFAFERLLKVKQKVYGKGRKASAFKDFERYKEEGK